MHINITHKYCNKLNKSSVATSISKDAFLSLIWRLELFPCFFICINRSFNLDSKSIIKEMFPDKSIITGANNFSIISILSILEMLVNSFVCANDINFSFDYLSYSSYNFRMFPLTDKARPISSKKTISDLVSRPKITPSTLGA